jgi:hypothetical protein
LAGGGHSADFAKIVSPAVDSLRYACKRMQRYALQMSSRKYIVTDFWLCASRLKLFTVCHLFVMV